MGSHAACVPLLLQGRAGDSCRSPLALLQRRSGDMDATDGRADAANYCNYILLLPPGGTGAKFKCQRSNPASNVGDCLFRRAGTTEDQVDPLCCIPCSRTKGYERLVARTVTAGWAEEVGTDIHPMLFSMGGCLAAWQAGHPVACLPVRAGGAESSRTARPALKEVGAMDPHHFCSLRLSIR